ncbi:RtcB family protein (plasmid) [Azospirillum sp. HJ39]|uniref:RtcB family protein n=1 Tax=Azospirillum sp. HJ39 TaxID=3159496 RepID=UPI003558350F
MQNDSQFIYHAPLDSGSKPLKTWTAGVPVEEAAMQQLRNVAALPFVFHHVAAMPDVHWGKGATIGSVIPTRGAIVPAAVGVDIGCGMCAAMTGLTASDLPDNLRAIRSAIEAAVPHGRTDNGGANDRGAWGDPPAAIADAFTTILAEEDSLKDRLDVILAKHPKLERAGLRAPRHLGTLGTGNHFIEMCLDEADRVWVMLHSGSRGVGNAIGTYFIERAQEECAKWFVPLPDKDSAYLPEGTPLFDDYVEAVAWAQDFAQANCRLMMDATMQAIMSSLGRKFDYGLMAVNCHHNYVVKEHHFGANVWVTRKGAVRARAGELGIIPGSMGAKSFIVRGKGNHESFCSCSHGAGRAMSRAEAKKRFTISDHETATAGVECRKDLDVIHETPAAYKSIDAVMDAQSDLVEIVHTLRQVVCVKG